MTMMLLIFLQAPQEPQPYYMNPNYVLILGGIALSFIAFDRALGLLERYGFITRRGPERLDSVELKPFGMLSVENAESKIRHAVRGELQPIVNAISEMRDANISRLDRINTSLVRLITLEEARAAWERK